MKHGDLGNEFCKCATCGNWTATVIDSNVAKVCFLTLEETRATHSCALWRRMKCGPMGIAMPKVRA